MAFFDLISGPGESGGRWRALVNVERVKVLIWKQADARALFRPLSHSPSCQPAVYESRARTGGHGRFKGGADEL